MRYLNLLHLRATYDAAVQIKVALPMPFSLLPKPLVESTGNAALATVTPLLMVGLRLRLCPWACSRCMQPWCSHAGPAGM